jgi:hypothetical protein
VWSDGMLGESWLQLVQATKRGGRWQSCQETTGGSRVAMNAKGDRIDSLSGIQRTSDRPNAGGAGV